jgi:hypothetical protein
MNTAPSIIQALYDEGPDALGYWVITEALTPGEATTSNCSYGDLGSTPEDFEASLLTELGALEDIELAPASWSGKPAWTVTATWDGEPYEVVAYWQVSA